MSFVQNTRLFSPAENVGAIDLACAVANRVMHAIPGRVAHLFRSASVLRSERGDLASYEVADLDQIQAIMKSYWRSQGIGDATIAYFLRDAFLYADYQKAVRKTTDQWGALAGNRVLDLGCGWGSLSLFLAREGADVYFADRVDAHVEVASKRVPSGHGFVCDARDLGPIAGELPDVFDHIYVHSLIEHVGNNPDQRGAAEASLDAKRQVLKQVSRFLKSGGTAFLSTGNYNFPLDGEIKVWLFHWLPRAEQAALLQTMGIEADNYGLLSWKELQQIVEDAGLLIERVEPFADVAGMVTLLKALSWLVRFKGYAFPRFQIEQFRQLMKNDPHYMPNWAVYLRKV